MPTPETLPRPQWNDQLEIEHAQLGARLQHLLPCLEWPLHLPWIDAINQLKLQRGAHHRDDPRAAIAAIRGR